MSGMLEKIYENSPWWWQNVMVSVRGWLDKRARLGRFFRGKLAWLQESQFWPESEIEDYQDRHLRELVDFVYENVPFYRERFDACGVKPEDIRTREDLRKLPVLTKEELIEGINAGKFPMQSPGTKGVVWCGTSGSTGKALRFCAEKEFIEWHWAVWWRHRMRFGVKPEDRFATFTGKHVVPFGQKKPPFWRESFWTNQTVFGMQYITPQHVSAIVDKLNRENYVYYAGYPSIIASLAELILSQNLELKRKPKVIFTGAERMQSTQLEVIKKVFGCVVTDQYGFSEGAANASRCECGNYHEDFEYGILEVEPIERDSGIGMVLGTGFSSKVLPLIRYKVGDYCELGEEVCPCGRHSRVFKAFEGRLEDKVVTPEGTKISRFDYIFKNTPGVREAQIVQEKLGEITIRVIPRSERWDEDKQRLLENVRVYISPTIAVNFEQVEELERTSTGKFKAVVSRL